MSSNAPQPAAVSDSGSKAEMKGGTKLSTNTKETHTADATRSATSTQSIAAHKDVETTARKEVFQDDELLEGVDTPSELAVKAVKNKKSAIKRGHVNAAWDSTGDLSFWLKDVHRWSKVKLESVITVAAERITLTKKPPPSGEIPAMPRTESEEMTNLRDELRRYLNSRISRLRQEAREAALTQEALQQRLYSAAGENKIAEMMFCISRGVDVNARPPDCSDTALHFATYWGKEKAVDYLISVDGIDLLQKDEAGDTALEIARHFGHAKIAQVCLLH